MTIAYNQNTTLLASAGVDRSIFLWSQAQNYDNVAVLKGHTNAVTSLTWTYTDRLLTASADKSITNWDVEVNLSLLSYKNPYESIRVINALFTMLPLRRRHWIFSLAFQMMDV